jgi:hypothetical protein
VHQKHLTSKEQKKQRGYKMADKKKEAKERIRLFDPKKMPSIISKYELEQMNKRAKKKKETGKKDIFDYIGDITISTL